MDVRVVYGMKVLAASCALWLTSLTAQADTIAVQLIGQGAALAYAPSAFHIAAGDRIVFAASAAQPLRFDQNPALVCTSDCVFRFAQAGEVFAFYSATSGGPSLAGVSGSFVVDPNPDLIFTDDLETPVVPAQPFLPTIASFTTTRSSLVAGQSANLAWSVGGATGVMLDPGIGDAGDNGSHSVTVSPTVTTRYTLTASNFFGSVSARVRIDFLALQPVAADAYLSEHALFLITDPAQTSFPDYASVFSLTNLDAYVARLKAVRPDDYLMVVVAANGLTPNTAPNVITRRHLAYGIGDDAISGVGLPNLCRYNLGGGTVLDGAFAVLDHEVGHNWGARVGLELGNGHWYSNSTVHSQLASTYTGDGYLTIKQIDGDPQNGFTWQSIGNLAYNDSETLAEQDLYAMGLAPRFPTTYVLGNPVYNADAGHSVSYGSVAQYDHAWMVAKNGPRVPDYTTSPKRFRFGFVYVARDLAEIQTVYAPIERSIAHFVDAEQISPKFRFQVPFLVDAQYRASISARLADLDGNASPQLALTGPAYFLANDGMADVGFAASDSDGPAPTVSLVPASAFAQVAADHVALTGLPSGVHFFTLKAEDALGKKDFAHFVVEVP